jgi:glycosyltransferase involved in cell wall biosynthesis
MNKKIIGSVLLFIAITVFSAWSYVHRKKEEHPFLKADNEKFIAVIIPSYNNIKWYQRNLDSVFGQRYSNYRVIYIDDASPDGTRDAVRQYVIDNNVQDKITVISNAVNKGALANIYDAVHSLPADTVCVTLDGDDWFAHEHVFEIINNAYADANVWMTYGNYTHYPDQKFNSCCADIPQHVIDQHAYRRYIWCASHLRTFYAWLFQKIKKEDLCDENGFYRVTWDQAFMFPMLEMAAGRWRFISEILYVYNVQNPLNDFKVRLKEQLLTERIIRAKHPYAPLVQKGL